MITYSYSEMFKRTFVTPYSRSNDFITVGMGADSIVKNNPKLDSIRLKSFYVTSNSPPGYYRKPIDTTLTKQN